LQDLKAEIDEAEKIANDYEGGAEENMNSFKEEMQNKREVFTRQFLIANNDLQLLHRLDGKKTDAAVQLGSVVFTENQKLFISVSLGKLKFQEQDFFAISTLTPLYKAIAGKKAGEIANFNGKEIKLVEVF
jgi:hypothetical protein